MNSQEALADLAAALKTLTGMMNEIADDQETHEELLERLDFEQEEAEYAFRKLGLPDNG